MSAADWAASGRRDTFSAALVDPFTLQEVAPLDVDWANTSVEYDYTGDVVASASIRLVDGADYRIGRKSYMVRLCDAIELPDGTAHDLVLGTFFCMYDSGTSLHGRNDRTLLGYSCLWRHSQDVLRDDFWRARGYGVVAAIEELVRADGGGFVCMAGVDRSRTFGTDVWFEAGTNKLEAIREMAGWIGCEVMPGGEGSVYLRRNVAPEGKAPSCTFEEGASCLYKAGMEWSSNRSDLVNRVVYVYSSGDETQTGVADLPATARMSYQNVGYHVTMREESSEMPDGGVQAEAERLLAENSCEVTPFTVEALLVPGVQVGDVAHYTNSKDWEAPLDVDCQVQQLSVPALVPGLMAQYKLKILGWGD